MNIVCADLNFTSVKEKYSGLSIMDLNHLKAGKIVDDVKTHCYLYVCGWNTTHTEWPSNLWRAA